jgi:hypothetical protein
MDDELNIDITESLKPLATKVIQSYREGIPVVIRAKDGGVLHGEDTLRVIVETGVTLKALTISGVDRQQFEETDLPEVCEAARVVWLQDGFPKH